jgi:hypothetical protein
VIRELLKLRILARSPIIYRAGLKSNIKKLQFVPAPIPVEIIGPVGSGRGTIFLYSEPNPTFLTQYLSSIGRFSFEVIQLEPGPGQNFQDRD